MTLKECYAALEGDYEGVLSRLPSEKFEIGRAHV